MLIDSSTLEKPRVDAELLKDLHQIQRYHYQRLLIFLLLYLLAACVCFWLAEIIGNPWCFVVCLPLYLIAAACLHGISLFTHEGVHNVLDPNRHLNRILSILCALPVGQNFTAYQVLHLKHHKYLGLSGDPDRYKNYTKRSRLISLMYWGRLIIGYPVYLVAIPILGFRQGNIRDRFWISLEVILLGVAIASALLSPIPDLFLIHGWLIPMIFINTLVNIRGMSQHTLLEHEFDLIRGTRTILSNPVTRFFMCNENYHLEHHLYPGVPWYNLPRLHQAIKDELIRQGAPYISSYFAFVRDFAIASFMNSSVGTVSLK
jgi:fatty acid desaturase